MTSNNETRQIMYDVYGEEVYEILNSIMLEILKNMNIPAKDMPIFKLEAIDAEMVTALYDNKNHVIIFDPLKSNKSVKDFIYIIMHECEHVWQWVNYPDIMKFFAVNRKVYIESYQTAFNIPEFDAMAIESSMGRKSLRGMFEKYDIHFFEKHVNDWRECLEATEAESRRLYLQGATDIPPILQDELLESYAHLLKSAYANFLEEVSLFS